MKSKLYIFFGMLLFSAVADAQHIADYALNVQDFRQLRVVDGVNVDYYANADSAGMVVFSCAPELASELMFTNIKQELSIQTGADEDPIVGMPRIKVYSTILDKAVNTGDSTLRLMQIAPVKKLKIQQMGNGVIEAYGINANKIEASIDTGCGSVKLHGTAQSGKLRNVGTGFLNAFDLEMVKAKIFSLGSGPISCDVSEKLIIVGMGSGRVITDRRPEKVSKRALGVKLEIIAPEEGITVDTVE